MKRFWLKLSFWAVINVAAVLFAVSAAFAEVISEHDRQDMALKMAMIDCKARGGSAEAMSWKQETRWKLDRTAGGYRIIGNALFVTCEIPQASGQPRWIVTWTAPTTRADGTALAVNQIAGYQITINGKTEMVTGTSYTATGLSHGTVIQLRTVDTSTPALVSTAVSVALK